MRIIDNKYYLIDLDGVVLDTSYDNYFWQKHIPRVYAQKKGIDEKDAISVTHTLFNYKKKTKDWYDIVYWSNLLDIDIIHEKKKSENMSLIKLHEGSLNVLERLNNLNKKLSDSLKKIGGKYYSVRGKKLEKMIYDIQNNRLFRSTLGGCIVEKVNDTIIISKEG